MVPQQGKIKGGETIEFEVFFSPDHAEPYFEYADLIIEDVPTYPGCSGNNQERKDCFSRMVQKHFGKKFNADLPNELGLSPGKKRVFIGFKIDKNGNVVDIQTRAPHPKIKDEVEKVMSQLPKMKPGKQRGKPVGVKYSIPFTLIVE